jgi:NhaP-type Na+/H+ or K+/H+ antiporter
MVNVNKEKLREAHKEVLLNRIAFISLGLGCFLSVFSTNNGVNLYLGALIVVVVSFLWTGIGVLIARIVAVVCNKEDRKYPYEELSSIIDKDIATNITNSEIDEICQ